MTKLNKTLLLLAVVLAVLAAFTYQRDAGLADRFEAGRKFLPNLNPDEIAGIVVATSGTTEDDAESVTLTRSGDQYTLAERNGYVARNEEVNRLVRDLLDVSLEKRMGEGEALVEELGLEGEGSTSVTLQNAAGEDMVVLRLGDTADSGGRYVQRTSGEDQAIYRTDGPLSISAEAGTFLRKEIVDHSSSEVVRIAGPDFLMAKQQAEDGSWEGTLALEDAPERALDSAEVNKLSSLLSRLSFDEVYLASDPRVSALNYDRTYVYDLDDRSGYRLEFADQGDEHFLRIRGLFNVDRLEVSQDETDEQLEQKADVLRRSEEIGQFDQFHGSWVYKISATKAEALKLNRDDLLE